MAILYVMNLKLAEFAQGTTIEVMYFPAATMSLRLKNASIPYDDVVFKLASKMLTVAPRPNKAITTSLGK